MYGYTCTHTDTHTRHTHSSTLMSKHTRTHIAHFINLYSRLIRHRRLLFTAAVAGSFLVVDEVADFLSDIGEDEIADELVQVKMMAYTHTHTSHAVLSLSITCSHILAPHALTHRASSDSPLQFASNRTLSHRGHQALFALWLFARFHDGATTTSSSTTIPTTTSVSARCEIVLSVHCESSKDVSERVVFGVLPRDCRLYKGSSGEWTCW